MIEKVITVIVTFNRKSLLKATINSVLDQTKSSGLIIIVDNASTDGTADLLNQLGYLDLKQIKYYRSPINTGGAGGFNIGMSLALQEGADWIWVMDDDVAPEQNCLEELLNWKASSECIHPRRIKTDGLDHEWEHYVDILTCSRTPLKNLSFQNNKIVTYTNAACFEGMLVSKRIAELCGPPDDKYFIGEDDTLFGVKSSVYTNNMYVYSAKMKRLLPVPDVVQAWKRYYLIRNKFYFVQDATEFLGINFNRIAKFRLILLSLVDVAIASRHGFDHLRSSVKGFFDGVRYILRRGLQISDK